MYDVATVDADGDRHLRPLASVDRDARAHQAVRPIRDRDDLHASELHPAIRVKLERGFAGSQPNPLCRFHVDEALLRLPLLACVYFDPIAKDSNGW